jgi:hypothetical protein
MYEGVRWIETPRAPEFISSGASLTGNVTTYSVYANSQDTTGTIPDVMDGYASGIATAPTTAIPAIMPLVGSAVATSGAVFKDNTGATISDITNIIVNSVNGTNFTLVYKGYASGGVGKAISCTTAGAITFASTQTQANVYGTLILGRQSLAKAHALADGNGPLPSIVPGPVTDLLRRFVPLGWYWLGGYSIFRQAAVYRLESVSSLNDQNVAIDL